MINQDLFYHAMKLNTVFSCNVNDITFTCFYDEYAKVYEANSDKAGSLCEIVNGFKGFVQFVKRESAIERHVEAPKTRSFQKFKRWVKRNFPGIDYYAIFEYKKNFSVHNDSTGSGSACKIEYTDGEVDLFEYSEYSPEYSIVFEFSWTSGYYGCVR